MYQLVDKIGINDEYENRCKIGENWYCGISTDKSRNGSLSLLNSMFKGTFKWIHLTKTSTRDFPTKKFKGCFFWGDAFFLSFFWERESQRDELTSLFRFYSDSPIPYDIGDVVA